MAGRIEIEKVLRDIRVPGAHIVRIEPTQYGGQGGYEMCKNKVFFYHVPEYIVRQLETDGVIDFQGNPKG